MKKILLSLPILALALNANAQSTATFDDLELAAESYWDGSDGSAMFVSGDFGFINNFVDYGAYTSWDGFGYSNRTATSYDADHLDTDQWNSCVGHGAGDSKGYAVCYYSAWGGNVPTVIMADASEWTPSGCYVTNSAYALTSMSEGDAYAKKFGEDDWFLLTATGYLGDEVTGTATFYLASEGKIVDTWQWFDLSSLGRVDQVTFSLTSSDTGEWGMNTPAYFCLDDFNSGAPEGIRRIESNDRPAAAYDLAGRRVAESQRGLIVSGGRKVMR